MIVTFALVVKKPTPQLTRINAATGQPDKTLPKTSSIEKTSKPDKNGIVTYSEETDVRPVTMKIGNKQLIEAVLAKDLNRNSSPAGWSIKATPVFSRIDGESSVTYSVNAVKLGEPAIPLLSFSIDEAVQIRHSVSWKVNANGEVVYFEKPKGEITVETPVHCAIERIGFNFYGMIMGKAKLEAYLPDPARKFEYREVFVPAAARISSVIGSVVGTTEGEDEDPQPFSGTVSFSAAKLGL